MDSITHCIDMCFLITILKLLHPAYKVPLLSIDYLFLCRGFCLSNASIAAVSGVLFTLVLLKPVKFIQFEECRF